MAMKSRIVQTGFMVAIIIALIIFVGGCGQSKPKYANETFEIMYWDTFNNKTINAEGYLDVLKMNYPTWLTSVVIEDKNGNEQCYLVDKDDPEVFHNVKPKINGQYHSTIEYGEHSYIITLTKR